MYSMYKDLGTSPSASGKLMRQMTIMQKERDAVLRMKLTAKNVPQFPMSWSTFMVWRPVLEELTLGNLSTCLLFSIRIDQDEQKCLVLNNGNFTVYASSDAAHRAIYNISSDACTTIHNMQA